MDIFLFNAVYAVCLPSSILRHSMFRTHVGHVPGTVLGTGLCGSHSGHKGLPEENCCLSDEKAGRARSQ